MLTLHELDGSLFIVGDTLEDAAYLLIASVAFGLAVFPRWLSTWFVLAGALSLLQGTTSALGAFSLVILLPTVIVGIMGLYAGIAIVFWRPLPARVAAGLRT